MSLHLAKASAELGLGYQGGVIGGYRVKGLGFRGGVIGGYRVKGLGFRAFGDLGWFRV